MKPKRHKFYAIFPLNTEVSKIEKIIEANSKTRIFNFDGKKKNNLVFFIISAMDETQMKKWFKCHKYLKHGEINESFDKREI